MILPSKELLSEVLKDTFSGVKIDGCAISKKNNTLKIFMNIMFSYDINIYELAHKCKEWAKLKYFIDIDSHLGCARWGAEAVSHNGRPSVFYEQVFIGRTESEAIFKACEWIMEQKKDWK